MKTINRLFEFSAVILFAVALITLGVMAFNSAHTVDQKIGSSCCFFLPALFLMVLFIYMVITPTNKPKVKIYKINRQF